MERVAIKRTLRRAEQCLLIVAGVLSVWCTVRIGEAYYFRTLRVPPLPRPVSVSPRTPPPAAGSWLARLEAPEIGLSATVLEGSDDRTLARAAGHVDGTALPGESGNVGIAGHRDTIFRPLRNTRVGNTLALTTADTRYQYRVTRTMIVNPEDVSVLDPTDNQVLTLVTCYPFTYIGHAPRRFIVRAELIDSHPRASQNRAPIPN